MSDTEEPTFSEERCVCGCPWEGYYSMEDATYWRQDNWRAALQDSDHDDHGYAWDLLKDYIKAKWMDMLDDFFNEARRDTEFDGMCNGEAMFPRTIPDMIDMVLDDERTELFDCEDCSDSTNGARCYRNRPRPKKKAKKQKCAEDGES